MKIVKLSTLSKKAFKEIEDYQKGVKRPIKTGRPYIDNSFPLVNGCVITISAPSGVGKTFELASLMEGVMSRDLNPSASDYVCLNISLEMKILSVVLRGLNKFTGKSKRKLLLEKPTEEEQALIDKYKEQLKDDRFYISQVPTTPSQYYEACKNFLEYFKDKESVFITADHLALFGSDKGQNKNQIIEDIIEKTNDLKMQYPNVVFIFLSQMNSDVNSRIQEKSVLSHPRDTDLYYSQFTFQVSDYVVVIVNPYKKGINEYSKLNKQRYQHLEKYFTAEDSKGRVSLKTLGVLYYHLLKCREADSLYVDIFAEDLNIPNIEQYSNDTDVSVDTDDVPVFGKKEPEVLNPNSIMSKPDLQGFGFEPAKDDDDDFEPPF